MKHFYVVPFKQLKNTVALVVMVIMMVGLSVKSQAQAPAISYKTPQSYNIGKAITPLAPTNSGGAVGAVGYSSAITYGSNSGSINVAADATGNLYVADLNSGKVYKIPAGGGSPVILGTFLDPQGVAVDVTGNVFVGAGGGPDTIFKIPAGGGAPIIIRTKGFVGSINCMAVDLAGNIYVSDADEIFKIPVGGGPVTQLGASTFTGPLGIAVDAQGNLYVADQTINDPGYTIWKVIAGGGQIETFATFNGNFPQAVSVDPTGNVYFTGGYQTSNNGTPTFVSGIYKVAPGGGGAILIAQGPSSGGGYNGYSLASDGAGNIYSSYITTTAPYSIKKIKPNGGYAISPALPLGLSFDNSTGIISGTPTVSSPATNYTVTAYNSSGISSAIVSIKTVPAVSASLSGLTISTGTLTPAFTASNTSYTAVVDNTVSSVTLTPTTDVNTSTVTVNGIAVTSGAASNPITLKVGTNTINTVVTASDGTTTATYTITVTRAAPPNLASLILSNGQITPVFAVATNNYTVTVNNLVASMTVTPATLDEYSTVTVNGTAVESGAVSDPIPLDVGVNTISVVVTSLHGTLSNTYTLIVTRALSSNAKLIGLRASSGALSPAFSSSNTSYTSSVTVPSITITPTTAVTGATVTVNGTAVASGAPSGAIALDVGDNVIETVVTAQDGVTTAIYTITVTRSASSNDNLAGLTLSNGTLTPAFASGTTSYTATVTAGTTSVTVTPTAGDASAMIMVNDNEVTSGTASPAIALNEGNNEINIVVTASDGTSTKTYTIAIDVPVTSDARLSNLEVSSGTLTPAFSDDVILYEDTVENSVTSVTVTPTADDPKATILVDGNRVASGSPSPALNLPVGNTTVNIKVIAEDGFTNVVYQIRVTREASSDANLGNLLIAPGTLAPAFASSTITYDASVSNAITSVVITPTAEEPNATITVNGSPVISGFASPSINLKVGDNAIPVVVTPADKSTPKTYTITVNKAGSNNTYLSNLRISNGTLAPAFMTGTYKYTASVANTITAITVTPTTADPNAKETVNGIKVTSGTASQSIPLVVGPNTITIAITAQNDSTMGSYTVIVTRAKSSNANLAALKPSAGTLSPVFSATTTAYTESVANSVSSITITPTTAVTTSTVKVRGTTVTSGSPSGAVALSVGVNTINTIVTAQDGITTKTYTVTVTRAAAPSANVSAYAISAGVLTPAFTPAATSYTVSVANAVTTLEIIPTTADPAATVKVRGTVVTSGMASAPIALSVGANTINTIVTASNGTTKTYTLTVTRAAGSADSFVPIATGTGTSATKSTETPGLANDGIVVHQGVSPNGDGIGDFLQIDNISQYPDNKLSIMNRNGHLIYEANGYDNSSKVFDGHSSKNGQMQLPGTYFYQLDYTVKGITKHKTGFLVLKY